MKLIDTVLNEKKYRGFFAAVNTAKHGGKKPKKISKSTWHEAKKVAGKAHESTFVFSSFLLLEAEEIPDTEYGFWITAEGKVVPVPDCAHADTLYKMGLTSYKEAFDLGWIRVYMQNNAEFAGGKADTLLAGSQEEFGAEISSASSVPALYSLMRLVEHYCHEDTTIYFDAADEGWNGVRVNGINNAKRVIAKSIQAARDNQDEIR